MFCGAFQVNENIVGDDGDGDDAVGVKVKNTYLNM